MGKIVSKTEYLKIKNKLRNEQKKVVLCHGVFDLVHPGHIIHIEQAKKMGDILVVSITSEKYVRKGPGRPYFNDETRLRFLEAIEYIDYVMLSEGYTVDDIVETVEPDIYAKGEEYKDSYNDMTGAILAEQQLVEKHGGRIAFTSGQKYSSTKLINNALSGLSDEVRGYMEYFNRKCTIDDIRSYTEKIKSLRILVLGETVLETYTYCFIQGVLNKDRVYAARTQRSEQYWGGALATARHLASFTPNVTFLSAVGMDENLSERMYNELGGELKLEIVHSNNFPTIEKQYYLTKNEKREEYRKIFAVNNLPEIPTYEESVKREIIKKVDESIGNYDLIMVCDYGYGLISQELIDLLEKKAKHLAVNCHSDSSNIRLNLLTKYNRLDYFLLDLLELNHIYTDYYETDKEKLQKLCEKLKGYGWLTRGSSGAYGIDTCGIYECPAFTLMVKDTMGAENAFFAIACLYMMAGASIEMGTFMGNVAGALSTNIVGNSEPVNPINTMRFASTLMNV